MPTRTHAGPIVMHRSDPQRARNIPRERDLDSVDALPVGTARTHVPYAGNIRNLGLGINEAQEAYRMRTRPELYDDWLRESAEDYRAHVAHTQDLYDWDCHACKHAVMTPSLDDRCPVCWTA